MSLLVEISQAGKFKVIVNNVDPSLDNLVIHLPVIYRHRL